ncbi:butyrophilin subfamily 1 member A1-like isoform X2 [Brachionichthys hirsutus]|uniref:butyrophilin subfamily 1 member A1-like isoform X2 n=1 Tax=Brachionichthys hirsutus TaxID=412623 RepID=UPI0036047DAA
MNYCFIFIAKLLALSSVDADNSSTQHPSETVLAFAGGTVILPCSFDITPDDDFPTVEWSKEGLEPNVVFLYRDGCETHEMKHPSYRYRTSFITTELKKGNISLRISDVQLSDAGTYRCLKLPPNGPRSISIVELVVVAVTEPRLSAVSEERGATTVLCEAVCWLPEPEITFLDEQGKQISSDEPRNQREASGCYSVSRTATPRDGARRVTCIVYQPETNETRVADIILQVDSTMSYAMSFAIVEGIVILVLACALCILLWKMWCKRAGQSEVQIRLQKNPSGSRASGTRENCSLLGILSNVDLISKLSEKMEPR